MAKEIIELNSSIISTASVVGKKEFEGPLGSLFDLHGDDDRFGKETWEMAEGEMQRLAFNLALKKADLGFSDIGAIFAGDLLNQCIGSSYGLLGCNIPYFGIYGACSTSAEGLMLAAIMTSNKVFDRCAAVTSSHNCAAERQFRTPIEYGGQRTPTSQWTVTGSAAFVVGEERRGCVRISAAFPGRVVDKGVSDANNMGAAMAPALCDTLCRFFSESGTRPADYDLIATGDLGHEGAAILRTLMSVEGYEMGRQYTDCGILIFDKETQDTHSGGSGCGCSATVLSAYILPEILKGRFKKVLFIASGAMMSPDSIKQGQSIPAVGHLLLLETHQEANEVAQAANDVGFAQ